jgi:hypothetical protein
MDNQNEKLNSTLSQESLGGKDGGAYDKKGNSEHYKKAFMEYIREQERKYGTIIAYITCVSQVDKYEQRMGEKAGVPLEKDFVKKQWYSKVAGAFLNKINNQRGLENLERAHNNYVFLTEEFLDLLKAEENSIRLHFDQNRRTIKLNEFLEG